MNWLHRIRDLFVPRLLAVMKEMRTSKVSQGVYNSAKGTHIRDVGALTQIQSVHSVKRTQIRVI